MSKQTKLHATPQAHRQERPSEDAPDPLQATPEAAARKEALDEGIDSLLDEIDGVLEVNAQAFVEGFIQKGGQ